MARDTDEELRRLEQALWEESDEQDACYDEQDEEDLPEFVPEEDPYIPNAGVYQNYSNDYGKKLRNYASGYRAYNSDKTDTDLEQYSEEIREDRQPSLGLLWFLVILLLILIAVVGAVLWKYLGGLL